MGFSIRKAVYKNKLDFITKIKSFLSVSGWSIYNNDISPNEFIAYSNASGQLTTRGITPGKEEILIAFSNFVQDGLDIIKMQRATGTYVIGNLFTWMETKGIFTGGSLVPVDSGLIFNDNEQGYYTITTDGTLTESGSWIGIHTTNSNGTGYFGFQGHWQLPTGIVRSIENSFINSTSSKTITLDTNIKEITKPENFNGISTMLEVCVGSGFGFGICDLAEYDITVSQNTLHYKDPLPLINPLPNQRLIVSEWVHTRAMLDSTSVQSENAHYFKPGKMTFDYIGQGPMITEGSDYTKADPTLARNSFEMYPIGLYDVTSGPVLFVYPGCAMAVPKGGLAPEISKIVVAEHGREEKLIYEIKKSNPADLFYWAMRVQ